VVYTIFEIFNGGGYGVTPQDVKNYYGSQYNFRKMTGMSTSTLGNWLKWGFVPEDAQYKLERITKGQLKTEWTKKDE
jgi:hypothetical protein